VDCWTRLQRFLLLGSSSGSYYASERKLTLENAAAVKECLNADPARTVKTIVEISDAGRAPKNDPAIFALAMAAGHPTGKAFVFANDAEALRKVCRIGTHILMFGEFVQSFRGWGKSLRNGIGSWYRQKDADWLSYQISKYQSRNGWSHRDLLRLCHIKLMPSRVIREAEIPGGHTIEIGESNHSRMAILRWAIGGKDALKAREVKHRKDGPIESQPDLTEFLPPFLAAVDEARTATPVRLVELIRQHDLPRECVPTERLNDPEVWEALLEKMPLTAMVRNLGKMTAINLLKPMSSASKTVCDRLTDQEYLRKSRVHPLAVLLALKTYAQGHGDKGKLKWTPVSQVNDALDSAFYLAFGNVEPAGKRTLIALDVSGSMASPLSGTSLQCREAAAAMAMVTARTEPQYQIMAFAQRLIPIDITAKSRLREATEKAFRSDFGGTDCALPMLVAMENGWEVDTFITLTDSESWAGEIHASQALEMYRRKTGIPSRAVCVGMVANAYSVLDPNDAGSLNVVGFDAAAPTLISDFSAGRI